MNTHTEKANMGKHYLQGHSVLFLQFFIVKSWGLKNGQLLNLRLFKHTDF